MAEVRTGNESPEQAYYENETLWAQDFEQDPQERLRLEAASQSIPQGVSSLLDVGCGNGAFVNRLAGRFTRVCAVDRSEVALSFVKTEKRLARVDQLPFAGEFDLVACKLGDTMRYVGLRTARRMAEPFRTPPLPRVSCARNAVTRAQLRPRIEPRTTARVCWVERACYGLACAARGGQWRYTASGPVMGRRSSAAARDS
jgi:SAM-dependent methyltransferase